MKRCVKLLSIICAGFITGGIINFVTGLYYYIIKAGIPYQDPTVEMQIKYSAYMGTGEILKNLGICMCVIGIAVGVLKGVMKRKLKNKGF